MSKKIVATNKKALHEYHVESTIEAGIVLTGPEVKSLRAGKANLKDGYATVRNNEVFLINVHISPYVYATHNPVDPLRDRKLLLNRAEIRKLIGKIKEKGIAIIPLKLYFIGSGKIKVELALARGKKLYDKRADLKKKELDRDIERAYKKDK